MDKPLSATGCRTARCVPICYPLGSFKRGSTSSWLGSVLLTILISVAFTALSGCGPDKAKEHFDAAEKFFGEGNYTGAVGEYSRVVSEYQGSPYAPKSQYRIAVLYDRHLSDRKRAMDAYSTLLFLFPESPEAWLSREDMAGIYSRAGEHLKAIEEYEKLAKANPDESGRIKYLIAIEYFKMNDFRQSRIELMGLLEGDPDPELVRKARHQIAYTYYVEGDTEKAIKAFDSIINDDPVSPMAAEALLGKAKALEEADRLAEALELLEGLIDVYPNKEVVETRINWVKKRIKEGAGRGGR